MAGNPAPAHAGLTVWLTGLSASGKSTLSLAIASQLAALGYRVEIIDGDQFRQQSNPPLGFSQRDREENVRRIAQAAAALTEQNVIAIVAAISPYRKPRAQARQLIGKFLEVYVNAPIEVCVARDPKGLYQKSRLGQIIGLTGIDDPYEAPLHPDVECRTDRESPDESAQKVLTAIDRYLHKSAPLFITVVSGLPRSGTSLMMQMLAAGGLPVLTDGLRQPDEDNPRGYFEYLPALNLPTDSTWLAAAQGKAVKLVHLLLPALPQAFTYRVILMERPLHQVLASQSAMLDRLGRRSEEGSPAELQAAFAAQMAHTKHFLSTQPNFNFMPVPFESLFQYPREAAGSIQRFLDLPLDVAAMAAAVDPALGQRRRLSS